MGHREDLDIGRALHLSTSQSFQKVHAEAQVEQDPALRAGYRSGWVDPGMLAARVAHVLHPKWGAGLPLGCFRSAAWRWAYW